MLQWTSVLWPSLVTRCLNRAGSPVRQDWTRLEVWLPPRTDLDVERCPTVSQVEAAAISSQGDELQEFSQS